MRMRDISLTMVAAASLLLAGCGRGESTPPPNTNTDTPVIDIQEGNLAAPEEVAPSQDSAGDASGDTQDE